MLLCLVTVIFPLACVCLASCKRHVVQVGREYLLEPSPCARSTPSMASKRLKLKAVNDCSERRSFAQRFMVMKENLKDHFNWKKCFFCKKSQAATCRNMLQPTVTIPIFCLCISERLVQEHEEWVNFPGKTSFENHFTRTQLPRDSSVRKTTLTTATTLTHLATKATCVAN